MNGTKTYLAKPADVKQEWHTVDATNQTLGRLATRLARVLMGKHKTTYTPHVDTGDFVIVLNCNKVKVTGRKAGDKSYAYYTGYRGGYKTNAYSDLIERDPGRIIQLAVQRMLPKSKLGKQMLSKLKCYPGTEHPHGAQKAQPLDLSKI